MNTQIRLLVFDWDGTLVNSLARIVASVHHATDLCGLKRCTDAEVHSIIGLSLKHAFLRLYPEPGQARLYDTFRQAYSAHYLEQEQDPSPFYPGVRDVLENFRCAGYLLAVATGKSRQGLDRILQSHGMQDFFDITRCADETRSKPDPLMLQEILAHCAQPAHKAIMVGDSTFDLQMANRASIAPVAVSYGAQPLDVLQQEHPVLAIDNFTQLQDWLNAS